MKLITYNKISRRENTLLTGCFSLRFVVQRSPKDLNLDNPVQAEGAARGRKTTPSTELRSSSIAIELLRSSGGAENFATPHCASLVRGYPNLTPEGTGPDEYAQLGALTVVGKNIWVSDSHSWGLICYDENLKMVERHRTFGTIHIGDMVTVGENICLADNYSGWNEQNIQCGLFDTTSKEITGLLYVGKQNIDEFSNPVIVRYKLKRDSNL